MIDFGGTCPRARLEFSDRSEQDLVPCLLRSGRTVMTETTLTRELLERLLAGDLDAERRLFEAHRERLLAGARRHSLFRRLRSLVSADDVVQEVLWRSLSSRLLSRFEDRGRGSLDSLLDTVLDRTLVDMARRSNAQKRGGLHTSFRIDTVESNDHPALAGMEARTATPSSDLRAADLLRFCRDHLEEEEWTIWHAVEIEGLDTSLVGEERGISASAIRARLFRARQKLIRALEAEFGRDRPA